MSRGHERTLRDAGLSIPRAYAVRGSQIRATMKFFLCQIDDHRDRLFRARLDQLLVDMGKGDSLLPSSGSAASVAEPAAETRRLLELADGVLCLLSPEALVSHHVRFELGLASSLQKPGCLLLFPGVRLPTWVTDAVWVVPLAGFKDSGPGLPPGTDEWEILRSSTFVRDTLAAVTRFVEGVRSGSVPALPPVPPTTTGGP